MRKLPWWELPVELASVVGITLLTYWVAGLLPWGSRVDALVVASAVLLISVALIAAAHRLRAIHGGAPDDAAIATAVQRCTPYMIIGSLIALVAGVCGLTGLYSLWAGPIATALLYVAASCGLTLLAVVILRRGLRQL